MAGTDLWYDSTAVSPTPSNFTWDNTTNAATIANFGSSGPGGAVDLGGGTINAGGLQFNAVNLSGTNTAYSFTNGTINLGAGKTIDLRTGSTFTDTADRVAFTGTAYLAGSDIAITNANGGNTGISLIRLQAATTNNPWSGTLTLTGNSGAGLFVESTTATSVNNLSKIVVNNGASYVIATGTQITVPSFEISGTGSQGRGAFRFDTNGQLLTGNVLLTGDATVGTSDSGTLLAQFGGAVTGNHTLTIGGAPTNQGRIVFRNANNAFGALNVIKGNAQIGSQNIGTSGNGLVSVSGTGIVSGSGTIKAGLSVTGGNGANGVVSPGDGGGVNAGTLKVTGDVVFAPTAALNVAQFSTAATAGTSDRLSISTGGLALNGFSNIVVVKDTTYTTPMLGMSWTLMSWEGALTNDGFDIGQNLRSGADSEGNEGNLNLWDLSPQGYVWNIAMSSNSLVITIVPEASTCVLGMAGAASLLLRRRRKI